MEQDINQEIQNQTVTEKKIMLLSLVLMLSLVVVVVLATLLFFERRQTNKLLSLLNQKTKLPAVTIVQDKDREAEVAEDTSIVMDEKEKIDSDSSGVTPPDIDTLSVEQQRGLHSYVRFTEDGTVYGNNLYRFLVTLPKDWGNIKEKVIKDSEGVKIIYHVRLTDESDPRRYFSVQVVDDADVNDPFIIQYPNQFIASGLGRSYYYSSGGEYAGHPGLEDQIYFDMIKEAKEIVKTFELP